MLSCGSAAIDGGATGLSSAVWLGEPVKQKLLQVAPVAQASVERPAAYWIPGAWTEVIERLGLHGIRMQRARLILDQ